MSNLSHYLVQFAIMATKSILRKQDLQLPYNPLTDQADFTLTEKNYERWRTLFSANSHTTRVPFDYFWPHFTLFFLKMLGQLQINYRNILHLGHEVFFLRDCHGMRVGETVALELAIHDIAYLDHNRAVVIIESHVIEKGIGKILTARDTIFVKNLTEANVKQVISSTQYNHTNTSAFRNLSKRHAVLKGDTIQTATCYISDNLGLKYAKISGDYNPIHIQPWLAKLFGYPQAFLQGSAITQFLTKLFIGDLNETLQRLCITFCSPAHLGQTILVNFSATKFELISEKGALLAFGDRVTPPHPIHFFLRK